MKRKIITVCIVLMMSISCSFAVCYAEPELQTPEEPELELQYTTATSVRSTVTISSGKASYYVRMKPSSTVSYVKATLNLVDSSGTTVQTVTKNVYLSNTFFTLSNSKNLSKKGTYHATYVLKVYKNGTLKETIKGKSANVKY